MTPSTKHVYKNGIIRWYSTRITMQLHREDGPSVTYPDGTNFWHRHGKRHREDGPAKIWPNGKLDWYINDWHFDFNRWKKWVKLSEEELTVLIITYGKERLYVE